MFLVRDIFFGKSTKTPIVVKTSPKISLKKYIALNGFDQMHVKTSPCGHLKFVVKTNSAEILPLQVLCKKLFFASV